MPKHRKIPVVRPSAYPGARLDSATWRSVFGASFKKAKNAVYPLASQGQTGGGPTGSGVQSSGESQSGPQRHKLTFVQNFGSLSFPILLIVYVSIAWTTLLLVLNVAPNATANYLMNTTEFDDGSFWLIIDPSASQCALAAVGLGLVLLGYLYAFLKMTWWQNHDLPDSSSNAYLARITRALVREGSSRQQVLEFWTDLTGYQGQRRKFWNVWLKSIDMMLQIISLQNLLESGFPVDLCYLYSASIAVNALSCVFTILTPDRHSAFKEILIDSAFDMFFAVIAPLSVLIYSYKNFDFEREKFLLYMKYLEPGSFDRQARLMADPSQISLFLISFEELRLETALDFILRVGMNLSFCYRLKRVIEVRIRQRRKLLYAEREHVTTSIQPPAQKSVSKYMVLPFLTVSAFVMIYTHRCIDSSSSVCSAYAQCVAYAHRMGNDGLCPCLVLIDVDPAPKTYEQWMDPVNVTGIVQELAASGDLKVLQLINSRLVELPKELQWCNNMQHISLMYTGTAVLPEWVKGFTKLEFLNIQGRLDDTSLSSMPDDVFDDMSVLTFVHLAGHPELQRLPRLDGLVNLKTLSLVGVESHSEFISLRSLKKLERLELIAVGKLAQLPDLSSQSRLVQFVFQNAPACCNGYFGTCDLSMGLCSDLASCVDASASVSSSKSASLVLKRFNGSICTAPTMNASLSSLVVKDQVDACGGVMYRQCASQTHDADPSSALPVARNVTICYNWVMQVITCNDSPTTVAIRKMQIQRGIGDKCDPVEERWLGCLSAHNSR